MLRAAWCIVVLLASAPASLAYAQASQPARPELHALLVIQSDYVDPKQNAIAGGVLKDLETVQAFLTQLHDRKIVEVHARVLQGRAATRDRVLQAVKELRAPANGVAFLFYSGHGGLSPERKEHILEAADGKVIGRRELVARLSKSGARFKILLSNACAKSAGTSFTTLGPQSPSPATRGTFDAAWRSLFVEHAGLLDANSSAPGQYSWTNPSSGGWFVASLIRNGLMARPRPDWATLMAEAQMRTERLYTQLLSEEQREELRRDNVFSQSPHAFSMPTRLRHGSIGERGPAREYIVKLKNATTRPVRFCVAADRPRPATIGSVCAPGAVDVTLESGGLQLNDAYLVAFRPTAERALVFSTLDPGAYAFTEANGVISLGLAPADPDAEQEADDDEAPAEDDDATADDTGQDDREVEP